jgi:DNA-binding LacI/PurR family transcriptional regulator
MWHVEFRRYFYLLLGNFSDKILFRRGQICDLLKDMKNKNPQKAKIGLREIASAAHVSVATVCRVLNGNSRVDPAIQKNVLDAVAKLDVDLSQRNKTKALAFLLSNRTMLHAFHSRVLIGAEAYCAAHGWDMVFLLYDYSPSVHWKELHLPKVVQRRDVVRAVILAGTNSNNLIEMLDHRGIPSVVLGNNVLGEPQNFKNNDAVFSDDVGGGEDITRYLISLGHRDIWFVGNTRLPWFARCFEGYRRSMDEAGLVPRQSSIDSEDDTEIGYLGTKSLLAGGEAVTAIFAGNDQTAHGVYKALRDRGLNIPEDISVAGCDDTVGAWLYPRLTTIREFPDQLGKQMAQMILDRIAKPGQTPQRATVPTELIKRDSCRAIGPFKDVKADETLQAVGVRSELSG